MRGAPAFAAAIPIPFVNLETDAIRYPASFDAAKGTEDGVVAIIRALLLGKATNQGLRFRRGERLGFGIPIIPAIIRKLHRDLDAKRGGAFRKGPLVSLFGDFREPLPLLFAQGNVKLPKRWEILLDFRRKFLVTPLILMDGFQSLLDFDMLRFQFVNQNILGADVPVEILVVVGPSEGDAGDGQEAAAGLGLLEVAQGKAMVPNESLGPLSCEGADDPDKQIQNGQSGGRGENGEKSDDVRRHGFLLNKYNCKSWIRDIDQKNRSEDRIFFRSV